MGKKHGAKLCPVATAVVTRIKLHFVEIIGYIIITLRSHKSSSSSSPPPAFWEITACSRYICSTCWAVVASSTFLSSRTRRNLWIGVGLGDTKNYINWQFAITRQLISRRQGDSPKKRDGRTDKNENGPGLVKRGLWSRVR
jgi:hypothetical protein